MVRVEGTRETSRNGMSGTAFTIRVTALSQKAAEGRARGAMLGRFPANVGKIEVLSSTPVDSDIPGVDAFEVEVFVPHNNPDNEGRWY